MRKFKVLTGEFCHETNTFSIVPTKIENFHRQSYIHSSHKILQSRKDTRTSIGATIEAADLYGWTLEASLIATATPTGRITNETFEDLVGKLLEKLTTDVFDGILLHLHGAMVTEAYEDAEGEILRRVRLKAGPLLPVVVTLDLHGNVTKTMAQHASALIAVRTYPHIDFYERAWQACHLLQRSMKLEIIPVTVIAKRPMLRGLDGGRTQSGPMLELIERGELLEQSGEVLVVSVCAGFTAADIYDIGEVVRIV